jgi:hypothetical protein
MTDPTVSAARDDLAFVRGLVSDGGQVQSSAGAGLLAAGLCFGTQCVAQGLLGHLPPTFPGGRLIQLAAAILPTVVFMVLITRISLRAKRANRGAGTGVASRALSTAFGSMGLSILVSGTVFGFVAIREHSFTIWLFHPIMVGVAQGVGWYMASQIRRRAWYGAVAAGWFATALLLAMLMHNLDAYLVVIGAALFGLMALPGWVLWRSARAGD